ncbi:hypothetical protein QYF36_000835 [Acer negundo]|nr:hypothetical protein QYF36_000835 [Acer negundo]
MLLMTKIGTSLRWNASDDEGNVENLSENAHENSLLDFIQEIAKEDEENKKRHMRRLVAKQERLKVRPPCLGRHKFEPAPTQVLLSEEINGSLRKLKEIEDCFTFKAGG